MMRVGWGCALEHMICSAFPKASKGSESLACFIKQNASPGNALSGKALRFLSDKMASTKESLAIVISEFANDEDNADIEVAMVKTFQGFAGFCLWGVSQSSLCDTRP